MNNILVKNSVRFVLLVLLQVLIFNNIGYLGFVNPMIYLLFIMAFPYQKDSFWLIIASFSIGLCVDMFSNTGGLHAASSVFIGYIRPLILIFVFGKNIDFQELRLGDFPFSKTISYITILTILHHLLFYFLEIFNFNHIVSTLLNVVVASFFTITACVLVNYIFLDRKK